MLMPHLLLALALASPAPPADPIAAAFASGLAVIEDDVNPDSRVTSVRTSGCETRIVTIDRSYVVDWRTAEGVAMVDTFVHVSAPPAKFAVVIDAEGEAGQARLRALATALGDKARSCNPKAVVAVRRAE